MTVKRIKTHRNGDTGHFEFDYANGICRDLTVAAGQFVKGSFAGSLVYIMLPPGGDVQSVETASPRLLMATGRSPSFALQQAGADRRWKDDEH